MPNETAKPLLLPAGAMIELDTNGVDEGKFRRQLDRALSEGHIALKKYREDTGDGKGKVEIVAKLVMAYDPDAEEYLTIDHVVKTRIPVKVRRTIVKEKNGRMLCQPTGSSPDSPDQQRLFDGQGRPIGTIDKSTGELVPEPEDREASVPRVAGRIAAG